MRPAALVLLRCVAAALALGLGAPARAADEAELKAAIVYKLMLFVEWPATARPVPGAPWVLCVARSHPALAAFRGLNGRPLNGAPLRLQAWPPAAGEPACHAAFLGADELAAAGEPAAAPGLLVVSDAPEPAAAAAAIVLQPNGSKLGFGVHMAPVRRAQLQLSAKLLRLAREIHE
jgi:hypothetical protein